MRQTLNDMNMEIVSIEKKTFEMMVAAFGALSEKVAALRRKSDTGRMERWLTGEEVCGQLRIEAADKIAFYRVKVFLFELF